MANRLKMARVQSILSLHAQGWSRRRIARELCVDRETVSRYVQPDQQSASACGLEITAESARRTLRNGQQRQRAAAAIELALFQPRAPLFEVRARGSWQQQRLKS